MPVSAETFVEDIESLVASPDICIRINQLIEDPRSSALDIANEIAKDPALTANILRIANSPYYGFPSRIDSLMRAISVIGTKDLAQLVIASSIIKSFSSLKIELLDMTMFWRHSLFVGMLARELASKTLVRVLHKERLFVAGVIHDLGQLVMHIKIPELMKVMYTLAENHEENFEVVEEVVFNLAHDEIGAALAHKWFFPDSLQSIIRNQFHPEREGEFSLETAIIHIANAYTVLSGLPGISSEYNVNVSKQAWELTGLKEDTVYAALNDVKAEFSEVLDAFIPKLSKSA